MSDDPVLRDRDGGVVTLTLNRPDRLNALSAGLQQRLLEELRALRDPDAGEPVRCLVVEGAGGAFSAGGDIDAMKERFEMEVSPDVPVRHLEELTNRLIAEVVRFPAPTVAKINGPAVGAGANLAVACDLQLAREDASIGFVFRQVGLAVDAGTSYLLPRVVGLNTAKELVYTGEILDAGRAVDLGLFNRAWEAESFDEKADAMIERIASGPSVALRHSKRLLEEGLHKSLEEALQDESANQGLVFETEDHREGVEAFLADRSPEFQGR